MTRHTDAHEHALIDAVLGGVPPVDEDRLRERLLACEACVSAAYALVLDVPTLVDAHRPGGLSPDGRWREGLARLERLLGEVAELAPVVVAVVGGGDEGGVEGGVEGGAEGATVTGPTLELYRPPASSAAPAPWLAARVASPALRGWAAGLGALLLLVGGAVGFLVGRQTSPPPPAPGLVEVQRPEPPTPPPRRSPPPPRAARAPTWDSSSTPRERAMRLQRQAQKAAAAQNYDRAYELAEESIAADPSFPDSRTLLALVHKSRGNHDQACAAITDYIRLKGVSGPRREGLLRQYCR